MGAELNNNGTLSFHARDLYEMRFPTLLSYAARGKDFLFIADSHSNLNALLTAISSESIAMMKAIGIKHLCLEVPKEFQKDIDGYFNSKYTYEQIAEVYETSFGLPWLNEPENRLLGKGMAAMLKQTKEAGIRVHYLDSTEPEPIAKEQPQMAAIWDKMVGKKPQETEAFFAELEKTQPGIGDRFAQFTQTMFEQRFARDLVNANLMKTMAKDGKVAMIYGANHFAKAHDVNEYVGKDRSTVISMQKSFRPEKDKASTTFDENLPDFVFFTDFQAKGGKTLQVGAKIQPDEQRTDACKMAVQTAKQMYYLIGCTMVDTNLENVSTTRLPTAPASRLLQSPQR